MDRKKEYRIPKIEALGHISKRTKGGNLAIAFDKQLMGNKNDPYDGAGSSL
jgi:hypothetical protein